MLKKKASDSVNKTLNGDAKLLKFDLFEKFYNNKDNLKRVVDVVLHNTEHSLRILEWFCSNYAKKNNIIYKVTPTKEINVYLEYKACLDSYSKRKFDPFKRDHAGYSKFEIPIDYSDLPNVKKFETTVGQLNFFRWCIRNKILDYVKNNIQKIKDDMNAVILENYKSIKLSKNNKDSKNDTKTDKDVKPQRKKRVTLSVSAIKSCIKNPSSNKTVKF